MAIPKRQRRLKGRYANVDGIAYQMPVDSWDASAIMAAFPCDYEAARALLPEGDIHPFRLWKNALLVVTVIDYRKTDIGSYIEYSIAIACTKGAKAAPRLLPGIFMRSYGTGQFVVDLPVSTEISVKGGKGIWGMPKHRANLDYLEGKAWLSAQYDLDGQMVTRLDIRRPTGIRLPMSMGAMNYCHFRGMIMRSFVYFKAKLHPSLRRNSGRLLFGDHPKADALKALNVGGEPIFTAHIPSLLGVLDDYFDCWFATSATPLATMQGEGLETTHPLGFGEEWPPPPKRDPAFDVDEV